MKIKLKADIMTSDKKIVKTTDKIVEVKAEQKRFYIFDFNGKEYKILRKFATKIK